MKRTRRFLVVCLAFLVVASCASPPPQPPSQTGGPALGATPPKEAEVLWQKAEQEKKSGKVTSAAATLERIAQAYPGNVIAPRALHRLGEIQLEQGNGERALQYLDFLLYTYPTWEGGNAARLDRLRALALLGKKKQVMKEAMPLWQASAGQPKVQIGLAKLMADLYKSEGETETAFEWLVAGFPVAQAPEEQRSLTQTTLSVLQDVSESTVKKLYKKTPSEFMQVFLEYRLLQLEGQKGGPEASQERIRDLLKRYPTHPMAPELQSALRGGGTTTRVAGRSMEPPPPLNINKIGCLVPLNGPHEKYGRMVQRGLTVALEDWNKRNPNQAVNLIVKDAPAEGDGALKAFESLAKEDGVAAVIGPLGAQTVKSVTPAAERLGVPMLALTQREDDAPRNMYVLHVFLDNQDLVRSLVRYCRTKLGYTRFASLYPDDRYGQKLSKTFAEVVREEGGNLVTSVTYKEKTTDFKEPLQKLLTVANQNLPPSGMEVAPFEGLFIPDQIQTLSLIAPQLPHNNVLGATLLGTNLWAEGALLDVGTNYIEQAVFATPFYAETDTPKSKAFSERFQELYQTPPSYLEAQAYDALMLFLMGRSAVRGGATDRYSILQGIRQVRNLEGVAGTYSFTPEGDLKRNYLIFQVQNGQIVRVAN